MRCADTGSECIFIVPFSVSCSIIFGRQNLPSAMAKTDRQNVPHFKFTTLLECKFAATRNYWMIKIKSSQIQWIPTEYNKWHIQGILKKNGKIQHCIILCCLFEEVISKTRASSFITISKHSKTIKALGSWFHLFSRVWKSWWNTRTRFCDIALAKLKSLFLHDLMGNLGVNTQLNAFKIQRTVNLEI